MRRRQALLLCLIPLSSGCNSGSEIYNAPQVPLQTLLNSVPKELRHEEPKLKTEENSWIVLSKGYRETPKLSQDSIQLFEEYGASLKVSNDATKKVAFEKVFDQFGKYLDSTEKSLALNRPAAITRNSDDDSLEVLTGLRVQLTLFTRRAAFSLAAGEVSKAIGDYQTAVKMVRQLTESGAPLSFAVMASSLWVRLDRELRWAACHPKMTELGLIELSSLMPNDEVIIEGFERSLKSELHYFISEEVQRLRGPGGNSLRDRDARESYRDFDSGWDKADEVAAQVLDGHERPFDRQATVSSAVEIYTELLGNVARSWKDQVPMSSLVGLLVRDWPNSRLAGATGESTLAEAELKRAKPKLLAAANPYGRFAIWYFLPVSKQSEVAPFRTRADINATKVVIAVRRFKIKNDRLPANLRELQFAKILEHIPLDPFSGEPFAFDRIDGNLSSNGPAPANSAATARRPSLASKQEYVWSLKDSAEPAPRPKPIMVVHPGGKPGFMGTSQMRRIPPSRQSP